MYYGTTTTATTWRQEEMNPWQVRVIRAVLFFIPRANPDIEQLYPLVKQWALEVSDDGWPKREVGLDADGKPLFRTPNDRNTGFWTDMTARQFERSELAEMSSQDFDRLWSECRLSARSGESSRGVA